MAVKVDKNYKVELYLLQAEEWFFIRSTIEISRSDKWVCSFLAGLHFARRFLVHP